VLEKEAPKIVHDFVRDICFQLIKAVETLHEMKYRDLII